MDFKKLSELKDKAEQRKASAEELNELINYFLGQNETDRSYKYLEQLLEISTPTTELCNYAGLMALTLNNNQDAKEFFQKAVKLDEKDFQSNYNLALLHTIDSDTDAAINLFNKLAKNYPADASIQNDIAIVWLNKGEISKSIESFKNAIKIDPDNSKIRNNAIEICLENEMNSEAINVLDYNLSLPISEKSRTEINYWKEKINIEDPVIQMNKKARIAFFASHNAFLVDIIESLKDEYETRIFNGSTVDDIKKMMEWSDISWFEWCDDFIIQATKLPKSCQIVCRLHSYEAFTDMPSQVDWSKVDKLIFVNQSVKSIFESQCDVQIDKQVIHNGLNLSKFSIPENKKYGKKIASVGYINYKKNPSLLLYCFMKIYEYDNEYTFHIAGTHQDSRIELYFDHFLKENPLPISFDGWVKDMPSWYADKDFVISTSLFESFHFSIAEGMLSGLMPLIHNWYGSAGLYPNQFLYNDPDQCLELLKKIENKDRNKWAVRNRNFIAEKYDHTSKLQEIKKVLNSLLKEKEAILV